MFKITAVSALKDNYIWIIHDNKYAVIVDPGETAPVMVFLDTHGLQPNSILCTHRHADHIGGIAELRKVYNVPVYGRRHTNNPHITHDLHEGDNLKLDPFNITFTILEIPGHLNDHIAYYAPMILFCGDVLFGGGCGRNFEGSLAQLHHSLQRLAQLPGNTHVYCAHEYTSANLRFAMTCEPSNMEIQQRITATQQLRVANRPSLPSTVLLENSTNPFLRCTQPEIIRTLQQSGLTDASEISVFSALRKWRNSF